MGTGGGGHALLQLLPGRIGLGLPEPAGNIIQDALEGLFQGTHAVAPVVGHLQLLAFGAVEDHIHRLGGEFLKGHIQGEVVLLGQGLEVHTDNGIGTGGGPAAGLDGAVQIGFGLIGDHQVRVRHQLEAQAGAEGARARRIIEGEHPGLQLGQADAAVLAGVILGETQLLPGGGQFDGNEAAGMGAGRLDGIRQAAAQALFQHQTVNHQIDVVLLVLLALDLLGQVIQDAVHPNAGEALLPGVIEDLHVLALLTPDHGGQDDELGAGAQGLHPVHDLVDGLAGDLLAALGTVGHAHSGPQKAQIVINFRHRAHGGAGVLGGGLLVNGNGRGQALDGIHVGLVHLAQELSGIGRKALDVAALALGVDGIKGKAGFAGAGKARENHQLVSGDGQVDVLQIILSGALDADLVIHNCTLL